MASEYRLIAEEIIGKLSLIDENKNLLEYPYDGTFPTGLTDVGDGSILTSGISAGQSLTLSTFSLLKGEYQDSIAVTYIDDTVVDSHRFSLSVTGEGVSRDENNTIKVPANDTLVTVTLNIPEEFSPNWLIKPQIVKKGQDTSVWVPNMDKIGTYVDRRFNGTNAKIKALDNALHEFLDCIEIVEAE